MNQANKQAAKVALVTGGGRRIGAAIVQKLHFAGFRVVIHCQRSVNEAQALANQLNQQKADSALVIAKDLLAPEATVEVMKAVEQWAGRLDLLVNNASVFFRTDFEALKNEDWDHLFDANVKAPFLLSLAARNLLANNQGVIINITDIHGQKPLKGYAVYCQTKAALEMQTKALAIEFAPEIRVNAIAPGAILWPEDSNVLNKEDQQKIIAKTPLQRHGSPEFIAQALLSLVENPFITGQILNVDGGRSGAGN